MPNPCALCGSLEIKPIMDLGQLPVSNRFLKNPTEQEYLHPRALDQCAHCGLLQLKNAVPVSEMKPRYPWITYTEPEEHLDGLAQTIAYLPGLTPESLIAGVSF